MLPYLEEFLQSEPNHLKSCQGLKELSIKLNDYDLETIKMDDYLKAWKSLTVRRFPTAQKYKSTIMSYLKYVVLKGVDAEHIRVFTHELRYPVYNFSIVSQEHFFKLWEEMSEQVKSESPTVTSRTSWRACGAIFLLLWCGMTTEQIDKLHESDITDDGVKGYDLDLSEKAKNLLITVKRAKKYDGIESFIPAQNMGAVDYIKAYFRGKSELKKAFATSTVYKSGLFYRFYKSIESQLLESSDIRGRFIEYVKNEPSMQTAFKEYLVWVEEYEAYYNISNKVESETELLASKIKEHMLSLKIEYDKMFSDIEKQLSEIKSEIEKLKK